MKEKGIHVTVNRRRWQQVTDFSCSGPKDRVFILDPETGGIVFGDGEHGRRPAAGSMITVTYRIGIGEVGNVNERFYGLFRGVVTNNSDPNLKRRLRVKVPDVFGDQESGWAMPCIPVSGSSLPIVGSMVWIMFERGEPDFPVWIGTPGP